MKKIFLVILTLISVSCHDNENLYRVKLFNKEKDKSEGVSMEYLIKGYQVGDTVFGTALYDYIILEIPK